MISPTHTYAPSSYGPPVLLETQRIRFSDYSKSFPFGSRSQAEVWPDLPVESSSEDVCLQVLSRAIPSVQLPRVSELSREPAGEQCPLSGSAPKQKI